MENDSIELVSKDSLSVEAVGTPTVSSFSLFLDYGKLAAGLLLSTEAKYELGAQVTFFNRFLLAAEYGISKLEPDDAYINANYVAEGFYYRFGLGYKIDMNEKNNLYFRAMYAGSTFSDEGLIVINSASKLFETKEESFERENLSAHWYEIMLSSERRVWKGLYAGFHVRLRFMGYYDDQEPVDIYTIPGYGKTVDDVVPALNLYLRYSLERF